MFLCACVCVYGCRLGCEMGRRLTTMKMANALPRVLGSSYISASIPATMAMGEEANTPQKNRKMSSAGQLGAKAHAMVKSVKAVNVTKVRFRRPYCSLRGPHIRGPKT